MAETVYLLLGSNMGDRKQFIDTAVARLEGLEGLEIIATSPVYVSEARDVVEPQPTYLNQVVKGEFQYSADELLSATQQIEADLGRADKGQKLPRTIDIDILLFGRQVVNGEDLTIPHPDLLNRPFAMVPLLEIDGDLVHPTEDRPISEFLSDRDREHIILYEDHVARSI